MKTEYEIRILEINQEEIFKKLQKCRAIFKGEFFQKRYVYDLKPAQEGKWIRLRTNGEKTTLAMKQIEKDTLDGTKELEFEVDNFESANEFLERLGFFHKGYQENKRIQYQLEGVEIDIDTWPMIPTYMEIEGNNKEEIQRVIEKLQLQNKQITSDGVKKIYHKYGINLEEYNLLKF